MTKANKTIYLIRHGESSENILPIHQTDDSVLTDKGRSQAEFLAKRLSNLDIDTIISSSLPRTIETAEIINSHLNKPISFTDLLIEIRKPTSIKGQRVDSEEVQNILSEINSNKHNPGWRHSDEENFEDRKLRGSKVLDLIQETSAENILIVTHGGLIRAIVAYMLFGDEMTSKEYYQFGDFVSTKNTGITICKQFEDKRWKLITWNDLAHLENA